MCQDLRFVQHFAGLGVDGLSDGDDAGDALGIPLGPTARRIRRRLFRLPALHELVALLLELLDDVKGLFGAGSAPPPVVMATVREPALTRQYYTAGKIEKDAECVDTGR
ncbi:hypothetical protein [Pararhizobium mangrovi]|uniref:hypothetical protein n=1 Tax=Pararhizobium mangrovi TaxID=2590452 RepID=UPI0015E85CAD|nr:hypothetical protein [Pararhizobium mangrovi]